MPPVLGSVLLIALFCLLWAFIEWIGATAGLPGEEIVWLRYATHLVVLTVCSWPHSRGALVRTRHPWIQFFRSSLMLGMPLFYLGARARMNQDTVMAIFWIAPLMVIAADWKAASSVANLLAVGTGFAGVAVLLRPAGWWGVWTLALPGAMALCFAGYLLITHRLHEELEVTNLFYTAFWVLIGMSFQLPRVWQIPTGRGLAIGMLIGVLGLVAWLALDIAVRRTSPATVGSAFYLQPVFVMLIQVATTHVGPARHAVAGLMLIGVAVALQIVSAQSFSKSEVNA